jgi:hypothetical protein
MVQASMDVAQLQGRHAAIYNPRALIQLFFHSIWQAPKDLFFHIFYMETCRKIPVLFAPASLVVLVWFLLDSYLILVFFDVSSMVLQ